MASILALSNELLAKILADESISAADHMKASQVCRRFNQLVERDRKYSLAIDAWSHPTWKLVRRLLQNPQLGEQIVDITVTWERRMDSFSRTRAPTDWAWTPEEEQKISEMCKEWGINEKTTRLILGGKNSESLLSLIVCFTPRLKSLDLGNIDANIMRISQRDSAPEEWADEAEEAAVEVLRQGRNFGLDHDCGDACGDEGDCQGPENWDFGDWTEWYESKDHSLLFFENLQDNFDGKVIGSRKLPPGLANLQYFSTGMEMWGTNHSARVWYWNICLVLLLPRIHTVRFSANSWVRPQYVYDRLWMLSIQPREPHPTRLSTAKRLEVLTSPFRDIRDEPHHTYRESFEKIAGITGNLEWVYLRTRENERVCGVDATREEDELLVESFLRHNPNTLKSSSILINGSSFDEDGIFRTDAERRRDVANKQKAFELHRARYPPEETKISPIEKLGGDLISKILCHVDKKDTYSLMLTCHILHDVCCPHIWSDIYIRPDFYEQDEPISYWNNICLNNPSMGELRQICSEYGVSKLKHVERITFAEGALYLSKNLCRANIEFLIDQMQQGSIPNLKQLDIQSSEFDKSISNRSEIQRFLKEVKRHSEKLALANFSLRARINLEEYPPLNPFELFDLAKLRHLYISAITYSAVEMRQVTDRFSLLADILAASPNLEYLSISCNGLLAYTIVPEELSEQLRVLQKRVLELKKLHTLYIWDALIDRLFLLPPAGCRVVGYGGCPSGAWWQKFAEHPFSGIEELYFDFPPGTYGLDEEEEEVYNSDRDGTSLSAIRNLKLEGIKFSSLTRLAITRMEYQRVGKWFTLHAYPANFLELIIKENKQLSRGFLEFLASRIASGFGTGRGRKIQRTGLEIPPTVVSTLYELLPEITTRHIVELRSMGEEFQVEMRDNLCGLLMKRLEDKFGSEFEEYTDVIKEWLEY
ncbi:hypothetical protein TWF281_002417 [Arthrobotrys megalospora]